MASQGMASPGLFRHPPRPVQLPGHAPSKAVQGARITDFAAKSATASNMKLNQVPVTP